MAEGRRGTVESFFWLIPLLAAAALSPARAALASDNVTSAIEIASEGLLQNTAEVGSKKYLLAGAHQYHSLWAWDFAFASYGALLSGNIQAVHDSLDIYFQFQRPDGLIPRVIDNHGLGYRVIMGMLGFTPRFKNPLKAAFVTENKVTSTIPNLVIPWAASRYILKTQDRVAAVKWFPHAEQALTWIEDTVIVDGLIVQEPFSDWEDSISRKGRVAFTQELYAVALRGLSEWAAFLGDFEKAKLYGDRFEAFRERFVDYFWMPDRNLLRNFEDDDHITADANLFAVAFHLIDLSRAYAILDTLRASPLWWPMPGRPTWPDYPASMKSTIPKLTGTGGYHDRFYWFWITSLAAIAEQAVGNDRGYNEIMESLSRKIRHDGVIYEVYELKNHGRTLKQVRKLLYHAERPFTWSAGFFLEAALARD